jgi:hypothetical protein
MNLADTIPASFQVVEILNALIQPIMNIIPTTFDNAARGIIGGLLNSGNALLSAATMIFGGMAYEKVRDAVMGIVQPKVGLEASPRPGDQVTECSYLSSLDSGLGRSHPRHATYRIHHNE